MNSVITALSKTEICFSHSANKYYRTPDGQDTVFNDFHSVQWSIFLYYLSHTLFLNNDSETAGYVYYLNKIMHGVDWYYEIDLPDYFCAEHPVGSVLGRAKYGNGLFLFQGTTIGGNKGYYPNLGKNVILYANSSILGNCNIGNNVLISASAIVIDTDIPDNSIVFGAKDNLTIVTKSEEYLETKLLTFWR